ncbi:hypothetical protein NQ315_005576 [Exocentrus adspersus]|uniref:Methylenetetrahydrofolate reductase (NAD(P)H) n=1 Tax=Exocentrus adspersus TaxID=1586481 RepID=A0AAV8VU67_9CUCU|nr:hypothetical protein NQ315_005576 [Exocentrus adspersus]
MRDVLIDFNCCKETYKQQDAGFTYNPSFKTFEAPETTTTTTTTGQSLISNLLLNSSDKRLSIEICPGRNLDLSLLPGMDLNFFSITWHGASAERLKSAVQLASRLKCQGYHVLLHLAGRNLRRDEALKVLKQFKAVGVRNIFALQGDPSQVVERDDTKCCFSYAADLVRFIKLHFGDYFGIAVAGYPDRHPQSVNLEQDIHFLKHKISCGADFIITQASYDYGSFTSFYKVCKSSGIHLPIVPGVFVISSYKSLIGISKICSVTVPADILSIVSKNKHNAETVREFGIHQATELIKSILSDREHCFKGVHIFSLNDLGLVKTVVERLGLFKPRLEYPL